MVDVMQLNITISEDEIEVIWKKKEQDNNHIHPLYCRIENF